MNGDDAGNPETVRITVELARPSPDQIQGYNRAEKYQLLLEDSIKRRKDLIKWIEENGFEEEVTQVEEANVFGLVFLTSTLKLIEVLKDAPGVVNVFTNKEFKSDLPQPTDKWQ